MPMQSGFKFEIKNALLEEIANVHLRRMVNHVTTSSGIYRSSITLKCHR